jgi:hypothetical protein
MGGECRGALMGMKTTGLRCFVAAAVACAASAALADENGISFWVPGFFGSLASTPQVPGWALASIYYHTDVSASGGAALSREISVGPFNPKINININANVGAKADLDFEIPTYVFATPVFGGQAAAALIMGYGGNDTSLNATATAGPLTRSVSLGQDTVGLADLIPQFSDRWNFGVNNLMVYITGDIPVGVYSSQNLANIGIGHGAIDGGAGYTYFDPAAGNEFSATFGLTGNFKNNSTDYTNGIDSHLDMGLSKFLTRQLQVGLVGYFYDQLTADSGCAPILCPMKSRVAGIGPQIGYIFPVGTMQGYINVKGYKEFDAQDRPDGWNAWVTLVLSPAPPAAAPTPPPMLTKSPPHS